ncbi:MAG: ribonuclease III [Acidiferrobacterales bacterium]|nr:ribonuclease III [Acidiferrobacterales bacterium]
MADLGSLEKALDYRFSDQELLNRALTHRSYRRSNNERLEYLGDSILGFVIAETLFHQFPRASEGDLTKMRARLVRGSTLAVLSRDLDVQSFLLLGEGEKKSGGFDRDSILADALEAIFGAIYLDGGFRAARTVVLNLYANQLRDIKPVDLKDNKTRLQEILQKSDKELPIYEVISQSGKPHNLVFEVSCKIDHTDSPFIAKGTSRRNAEQEAAGRAFEAFVGNVPVA